MVRLFSLLLCLLLIGLMAPAHAADLTVSQLENSKYLIPAWEDANQGEWVQLKNGEFNRRNPENPLFVRIIDIAIGHLSNNSSQDAAVIYGYNTGGSGFFVMLCAVLNDHGQPQNIALADLEDRVKINSLSIRAGKIIVDMVTHGPNDPACCPTVKKIATYTLVGHKLVQN